MSRFASDEFYEEFPNQALLWQHNLEQHLAGAKGQAILRELHDVLLALPERKLIRGQLADEQGHVCTVGALAVHRGRAVEDLAVMVQPDKYGYCDDWEAEQRTLALGEELGLKEVMAVTLAAVNDDVWVTETDEERFERVLRWVEKNIHPDPVAA